jgi:hypothetical protein
METTSARAAALLAALVAALVMALVMAAGPALAAPGNRQGVGQGMGGGNIANPDNGNQFAKGGGTSNNPHVGGDCGLCNPF